MTTADVVVPGDWAEITPAWLTEVLTRDFPGAEVDSVTVQMRDDGTNRRARLAVTYGAGSGPATVFVKGVDPAHKDLIRLTSGLLHEPRLFQADLDLGLECPTVYAAVIDEPNEEFLLVMEDLTARGADPRDATRPLSIEEAASGVRGLGRMHGRFWGARLQTQPGLSWLESFVPWDGMQAAPLPAALERLGPDAPDDVLSLTIDGLIDDIWKPYIRSLSATPTLLHGDPHIGNTYLLPGGDVGFLDWQVTRKGNWSLDLGYFLQGALTVEDRRRSEQDLLAQYRQALALPADELPAWDEIWLRYRASVAHGLTLWLCTASAVELWQRPDIAIALAQRYSAAFADLRTADAIAELQT